MGGPGNRRRALTLLAVWGGVLLLLTLRPSDAEITTGGACIICGERGLADAILNVVLFLPLGALLCGIGGRWPLALATGLLLSGGIESVQFFLPGRDASLGDVLFNGAGAALGALGWPAMSRLVAPSDDIARRAQRLWSAGLGASFVALALALWPQIPSGDVLVEERPLAPEGGYFQGDVLARRASWDAEGRIYVRFTAVEPRWAFRPLLAIRDADGESGNPVLFGPKRDRLILRIQRPIDRWRLTSTDLELPDVFADALAGDTLTAEVEQRGDAFCLRLDEATRCELGYTVGSSWALLAPTDWFDASSDRRIDAGWLLALFLPLGFWYRGGLGGLVPPLLALGTALAVPALTPLLAAPVATLAGGGAGFLAGRLLGVLAAPRQQAPGSDGL